MLHTTSLKAHVTKNIGIIISNNIQYIIIKKNIACDSRKYLAATYH